MPERIVMYGSIATEDIDREMAQEMANVGIVPSLEGPNEEPVGYTFEMGGQRFIVTGYTTRDKFLARVAECGMSVETFSQVPAEYNFQVISTD